MSGNGLGRWIVDRKRLGEDGKGKLGDFEVRLGGWSDDGLDRLLST